MSNFSMPRSDINPEKGKEKKVRKARKNRQERKAGKQKTRSIQMPLSLTRLRYTDDGLKLWTKVMTNG